MGQQIGREQAAAGDGSASPGPRLRLSMDRSSPTKPRPPRLDEKGAPIISSNTRVDGGFVVAQGIYSARPEYDQARVRRLIVERKLSPFFPGVDDEDMLASAPVRSECPICFLVRGTYLCASYSRPSLPS